MTSASETMGTAAAAAVAIQSTRCLARALPSSFTSGILPTADGTRLAVAWYNGDPADLRTRTHPSPLMLAFGTQGSQSQQGPEPCPFLRPSAGRPPSRKPYCAAPVSLVPSKGPRDAAAVVSLGWETDVIGWADPMGSGWWSRRARRGRTVLCPTSRELRAVDPEAASATWSPGREVLIRGQDTALDGLSTLSVGSSLDHVSEIYVTERAIDDCSWVDGGSGIVCIERDISGFAERRPAPRSHPAWVNQVLLFPREGWAPQVLYEPDARFPERLQVPAVCADGSLLAVLVSAVPRRMLLRIVSVADGSVLADWPRGDPPHRDPGPPFWDEHGACFWYLRNETSGSTSLCCGGVTTNTCLDTGPGLRWSLARIHSTPTLDRFALLAWSSATEGEEAETDELRILDVAHAGRR